MADVRSINSFISKELLFERENAQQPLERPPHRLDPAFPPRPGLRRHQVHHRHALLPQPIRHSQVEIRRVGEHRHVRLTRPRRRQQLPVLPVNPWNVGHDLHQPDHRQARRIDHRLDPGRPQPRTGAAEKLRVGPALPQFGDHQRRVQVARRLPRRHQDFPGHLPECSPDPCYNRILRGCPPTQAVLDCPWKSWLRASAAT